MVSKLQTDPCPKHTEIMMQQNLFYEARKKWIEQNKKKAMTSRFYSEANNIAEL